MSLRTYSSDVNTTYLKDPLKRAEDSDRYHETLTTKHCVLWLSYLAYDTCTACYRKKQAPMVNVAKHHCRSVLA